METNTQPPYLEFLQDIKKLLFELIEMQSSLGVSDKVLILTTSVLATIALIGPYVHELWKNKFYSPDLYFKFKHCAPYCHPTELRSQDGKIIIPVYYFRFEIWNDSRRQAD